MTQFAAITHPGLKRSHNEDCYEADPDLGLWLVADGVGGHANGEVAAEIVRETIKSLFAEGCHLADAIRQAHSAILDEIRRKGSGSNMGSTVVALAMRDEVYEIAWVGDSRAYLFDGKLKQLTRDHSPVSDLVANGTITPAQAAHHPDRHVLSQSLGVSESILVSPGRINGRLRPGQQILLCSDGLTDELDDQAIAARLKGKPDPQEQVESLLDSALESGGHDNITVVLIGAPADAGRAKTRSASDLETTQDIARRNSGDLDRRISHDGKVWFILVVMAVLAAIWLLL